MNWVAQVGHVSAKDIRCSRWLILALLVALTLAVYSFVTGDAFGPIVTASGSNNSVTLAMSDVTVTWLPLVIVLVGVIALGTLVQTDRPLQADSFWTTRPLAPTAVLAAKLFLAVAVMTAPPLVAASVAIERLHTPQGVVAGMLAHAAVVQLSLLLATIVVATLTADMKGFVTASVLLLGGLLIGAILLEAALPVELKIPSQLAFIAPLAGLLLLALLYRGRTNGNAQRLVGFGVALALIGGAIVAPSFDAPDVPRLARGPRLSLTFGAPRQTSLILPFVVRVDDSSSARFSFARDLTVISGEHGTEALMPLNDTIVVGPQFPDLGKPVRWLTPAADLPAMGQLAISPADSHTVARGATSAELSGTVSVLRPRVVATLPLRDKAFVERDGSFISIYGVSYDTNRVSIYVHIVGPAVPAPHSPQFAVVNFARGEAILLDEHPAVGSGYGWVVLPWIKVASSFDQHSTSSRTPVPRDSGWYAGASLVAVDWVPEGQYHTSAKMALR